MNELFHKIASKVSSATGSPLAFIISVTIIFVWAFTGPIFGFSDTWQLVINTGTTIITFLMVFLIQNTQNRDAKAMHLKLDELIHANDSARNTFIDLEDLSDEIIQSLDESFKSMQELHKDESMKQLHERIVAETKRRGLANRMIGAANDAIKRVTHFPQQ